MTCIAIKDGVGAADTQATAGSTIYRVQKMQRLPDGGFAAGAGMMREVYHALQWLAGGEEGDAPKIDESTLVIVRPDKSIWLAEGGWPAFPIMDRSIAIGCGADLARQAMDDGLSPAEAVEKACKLDHFSSAPVYTMSVQVVPDMPEAIPAALYAPAEPRAAAKRTAAKKVAKKS